VARCVKIRFKTSFGPNSLFYQKNSGPILHPVYIQCDYKADTQLILFKIQAGYLLQHLTA